MTSDGGESLLSPEHVGAGATLPSHATELDEPVSVRLGELMAPQTMGLATMPRTSQFGGNATHILYWCHWLQVGWIDAAPVAAEVVELEPIRDWSDVAFIRPSVGLDVPSVEPEPTVPFVKAGAPFPAPVGENAIFCLEPLVGRGYHGTSIRYAHD